MRTCICILCPNGCEIEASQDGLGTVTLNGARCNKGREYAVQELVDPRRNVTSSVKVADGCLPLASVRLSAPIPKNMIFPVMDAIRGITVKAPVVTGQVVISDVLGLGCDIVATKRVAKT